MPGEILFDRRGNVALLTLNAPQRRNAFTPTMVEELLEICEAVDKDDSFGAAVVAANGESFCAGAHRDTLDAAGQDPTHPRNYRQLGTTYQAFVRVGRLAVPSIAAVRGHAVGAGVNLMLATDLRIIANDARVMTRFARLGIHPGGGHFGLMARIAGREATAALSLFGQEIDGRRAAELGIAWEALPGEQVETRALELAGEIANDPELSRAAVANFRLELGPPMLPWAAGLEAEKSAQMWSLRRKAVKDNG